MKNIKKIVGATLATLSVMGLGLVMQQSTAQAKSTYKVEKVVTDSNFEGINHSGRQPYHLKNQSQNVYLWNKTRTKAKANLKNYQNYTWFSYGKSAILSHNGKKAVYYYVYGVNPTNSKSTKTGMVWRGYLTAGIPTNYKALSNVSYRNFNSYKQYLNYIKKSPSQQLTREVLKLFPNTKLSVKLTNEAMGGAAWGWDMKLDNYNHVLKFPTVQNYFDQRFYKNASTKTRLALIKKALDKAGYSQAKRNKLGNGYEIGIYFYTNPNLVGSDDVPGLTIAKLNK